jgi:hypothetical protein
LYKQNKPKKLKSDKSNQLGLISDKFNIFLAQQDATSCQDDNPQLLLFAKELTIGKFTKKCAEN